jgi:hypothetical protein
MPPFIMLTRLNPDAVRSPRGLEQLERDAMKATSKSLILAVPDTIWIGAASAAKHRRSSSPISRHYGSCGITRRWPWGSASAAGAHINSPYSRAGVHFDV